MKVHRTGKFLFWLAMAWAIFWYATQFYTSGDAARWHFYQATVDGYAVDVDTFKDATSDRPVYLTIAMREEIDGPIAVPVQAGGILPRGANGVISRKEISSGQRVASEVDMLMVTAPYQNGELKGWNYQDSFRQKGIQTNRWSAVWNLGMILAMGMSLGLLAEAFTDMVGLKLDKIGKIGKIDRYERTL